MKIRSTASAKVMYIRDPVHGSIRLSPLQEDLVQTVEVQRLSFIHQLGTTFHSYPGAHGMRLSHALGVSHLAGLMGKRLLEFLGLSGEEREELLNLLQAAGMLHDVGHTPWSHTLEPLFIEIHGKDHMDLVAGIIQGKENLKIRGAGKIPAVLERHGVNAGDVADLIRGNYTGPRYLQQSIFGEVDADTLDYLQRDFYFTGVAFGHIEIDRIMSTMAVHDDSLVFLSKGHAAIRDFLFARLQMYSTVYLHRKTRIADMMLLSAARRSVLELGEIDDFHVMTDDELLSFLMTKSSDPWVREIAWRLKYRQKLFKQVFRVDADKLDDSTLYFLNSINAVGGTPAKKSILLGKEIAKRAEVDRRLVLVDMPLEAVKVSEERFAKSDITYLDEKGRILPMEGIDPGFAEYLAKARPNRNHLTVCCCPSVTVKVERACREMFNIAAMPLFTANDLLDR